jgi:AraC family transcriptional regulator, activator of mtrCDE
MDWVSSLLEQARATASIDIWCRLPAGARLIPDVPPGAAAPFHLLIDGQCSVHMAGRVVVLRKGDFLLLPRGQQHEVRFHGNDGDTVGLDTPVSIDRSRSVARATVIGGTPEADSLCGHYSFEVGAGHLLLASIASPLHVNLMTPPCEKVTHLTSLMRSVVEDDGLGTSVMLNSLAQVLLVLALQVSSFDGAPSLLNVTDPAVKAAIEAVIANPGAEWTVERLSASCHVSRATLVRRFRQHTGSTIAEFVTWVRVMRAADLLRRPGSSVAGVSEAVGYSSTSAFSRAFQSAVGTSPGRFARDTRA